MNIRLSHASLHLTLLVAVVVPVFLLSTLVNASVMTYSPTNDDWIAAYSSNSDFHAEIIVGDSFLPNKDGENELNISGHGATSVDKDHNFSNGVAEDFLLVDDGGGGTTLSIGNDSTPQFRRQQFDGNALLFEVNAGVNESTITITNLTINGQSLPDMSAVYGVNGDAFLISSPNFSGTDIRGTVKMEYTGNFPNGLDLNFKISLIHSNTVPEPTSLSILALGSLFFSRRPRRY